MVMFNEKEDILYALAAYNGEDPDWKQAYREAYETCKAQQEQIKSLAPIESRVSEILDAAMKELGTCIEIKFSTYCNAGQIEVWVREVGHFYYGKTIAEALANATEGVRAEKAAKVQAEQETREELQEVA